MESSKIYSCNYCDYHTKNKYHFKKHEKTKKHIKKTGILYNSCTFTCKYCHYVTHLKHDYDRHCKSKAHSNRKEQYEENSVYKFKCNECKNVYKTKNGLFKHRKKHVQLQIQKTTNDEWKQMIMEYMRQNQETQKQLIEIVKEPKQIINNKNTINVIQYLNTECKDAYNIRDFIHSLVVTFDDLERIEQHGYISGIKSSLVKALESLEQTKRPIHCTDMKRKQFYVKDEDQWKRDTSQALIQNAIREYNNKQLKTLLDSGLHEASDTDMRQLDKVNNITTELTQMYAPHGDKTKEKVLKEICDVTMMDKCLP
jgi:hypothetical protein